MVKYYSRERPNGRSRLCHIISHLIKFSIHPIFILSFPLSLANAQSLVHSSPFRNIISPEKIIYLILLIAEGGDRETVEGISERSEERKGGRAVSRPSLYLSFLHFISFRSVIHSKLIYFCSIFPSLTLRLLSFSVILGSSQVKKK